jgi:large subunit ribosomal protein L21
MFAVIKTGGKQYRVAAEDKITVMTLPGSPGDQVAFDQVLMVDDEVGAPLVAGATVAAEIVEQTRGPKVYAFKKRRRKNSKRQRGHRQDLTVVRITEILTGGAKPSPKIATVAAEPSAEPHAPADQTLAEGQAPPAAATDAAGSGQE